MEQSPQPYQSYTVRLARVSDTDVWRVTVYCAQDGQRYHFSDLATLFSFLRQITSDPNADACAPDVPPEPAGGARAPATPPAKDHTL